MIRLSLLREDLGLHFALEQKRVLLVLWRLALLSFIFGLHRIYDSAAHIFLEPLKLFDQGLLFDLIWLAHVFLKVVKLFPALKLFDYLFVLHLLLVGLLLDCFNVFLQLLVNFSQ